LIVLLVYVLLWLPPVQRKIKDVALREVMKITGSEISVGELHFRPFNSILLKDVYAADSQNDTLLYVHSLKAGFDLFRLLDNHLLINSIELKDVFLNVNKEHPDSVFNFQFLIDAFSSPDTIEQKEPSALLIEIDKVSLKNGRVNYDILSEPYLEEAFDYNHIALLNLNFDVNLPSIDLNNLDVSLNRFSLEEKKGFVLSDLTMKIHSRDSIIYLNDFQLKLPRSAIRGDVEVNYWGMELSDILSGAEYALHISSEKLYTEDVRVFYPGIESFAEAFRFRGESEGKFPQIHLPVLEMDYGKDLELKISADLADVNHLQTSAFSLNLERLYVTNSLVSQILKFTSGERNQFDLPFNLDALTAKANLSGSLPDFNARLEAHSEQGNCLLNANAGIAENGAIHFDANLNTSEFNLGEIMLDTVFGIADLSLDAKGNISEKGVVDALASLKINRFDFNSYAYRDIEVDGFFRGDSVQAEIVSADPNLPVELNVYANIGKRTPAANLYAKLSKIRLDSLNLLPDYPESVISMIVRADVKGFDPEQMEASLFIDSLFAQTQTGFYEDDGIRAIYSALENSEKQLNIRSKMLNVASRGQFSLSGVEYALKQAFPVLFPEQKSAKAPAPIHRTLQNDSIKENFNLVLQIRRSNTIMSLLGIQAEIPDSALFVVRYNNEASQLNLEGTAFCIFNETDTLRVGLNLSNRENNLAALVRVDNKSQQYNVNGTLNAEIEFIPVAGVAMPDMNINIKPTSLKINNTDFNIRPAHISIAGKRYEIQGFAFEHSPTEYLKVDGVISEEATDSLVLRINDFQISTILSVMKTDLPLTGVASGDIQASRILSTPFILSRKFDVDSILFDGNSIGNLSLMSVWSSSRQGLAFRASLTNDNMPESVIQGFYLPVQDSLTLSGDIKGLKLSWLENYMKESLYGLDGSAGANFRAVGSITNPQVSGSIYFDQARLGVKMLNTMYRITDSIQIQPNGLDFSRFTILDEDNKTATINGRINHRQFTDISPDLRLSLDNFKVLNNESHTDSLFFGNLQLSGSLSIRLQNKDWVMGGNLSHGKNNTVMINIPSSPLEAQRYSSITFVDSEGKPLDASLKGGTTNAPEFTLPLKISNLSFALDPGLSLGAIYNPATGDRAKVSGTGNVLFSMDMSSTDMNLLGDYEIEDGNLTLSLANITRKTFTIRENSKVTFKGDPLKTGFDITAVYNLRADLVSLDPSFGDMGLGNTKVNVECVLSISGELDNMKLSYNITLPNQPDDVQRKMEGLLYTDDIKIKQIAYLLALGSFMPPGDHIGDTGNIWTSLASSSITNQLNNLLAGMLSENWSIGTDLHTNDANFSQVEMDVNISTHLFNNRLTINTTLGYNNDVNQRENFTGDFDFEYKLTPNGNILLRFYNVTNNKYYEKARMTQGIGLIYHRQGKTFNDLFKSFRTKREQGRFNWQRERTEQTPVGQESETKPEENKEQEQQNEK
jgi:hypothetical protein